MVDGENGSNISRLGKRISLFPSAILLLTVSSCQLQQTQPVEPTVRIPPKVEKSPPLEPVEAANPIVGVWISNSEKTLASLNAIEGISDDAREYLKQNVFGLLTREFTETEIRTYFGTFKEGENTAKFLPYTITSVSNSKIIIGHTDPLTGESISSTLYPENDCYYELVSGWQYREYFCRQDENAGKKFIAVPKANQEQLQRQ